MSTAPNRPVSYALHIRPLFTTNQRDCMLARFDLHVYEHVKANARKIHGRLRDKNMPPLPPEDNGPWPDEWIALFKRWIDEGCLP